MKKTQGVLSHGPSEEIKHLRGNSLTNKKKQYDIEIPESEKWSEGEKSMMRSRKKAKYLTVISRMPINRKKNSIVI